MKRFLLFEGDTFYPLGGWEDLIADFDTLQAARNAAGPLPYQWAQIVDLELGEVVWEQRT